MENSVRLELVTFQDDDRYEFFCNGVLSEDPVGALTLSFFMGDDEMLIGISQDKKSATLTRCGHDGYTIVLVDGQSNAVQFYSGFRLNVQTNKIRLLRRSNKLNLLLDYTYLTPGAPINNRLFIRGAAQDVLA